MHTVKKLLGLAAALSFATFAHAAEGEAHGISAKAEALFYVGPLPVTNSMVTSWLVAAVLLIAIRLAIKNSEIGALACSGPSWKNLVEGILDLIKPIVGSKAYKAAFPPF